MATNTNDTSFDLCNLTKTVGDIEIETRELEVELAAAQADLELKEIGLSKLKESNESLSQKQAQYEAALLCLKGAYKEKLLFENKEHQKQLDLQNEEIAKKEVEIRKREAVAEMWQNRKLDLVEFQQKGMAQIEDKLRTGSIGIKLMELTKQCQELDTDEYDISTQMSVEGDGLEKEATSLSEQGKIMEHESILMRREIDKLDKEVLEAKSAAKLLESRVAAKKIRFSKFRNDE